MGGLDIETETAYFMTLPERGLEPRSMKAEWLEAASLGIGKQIIYSGRCDGCYYGARHLMFL